MESKTSKTITAQDEDVSKRIDVFVSENFDLTRSAVQRMIDEGSITVNNLNKDKNYKVKKGDIIEVITQEPKEVNIPAQDLNLDVLYEDEHLIVINKRQGMIVHPSQQNYEDTLVNALLYHCRGSLSGINGEIRPGIVHRLDKDTSGVMIAAKNDKAHLRLAEQIKTHTFTRIYNAAVFGNIRDDSGTIDLPLGRSTKDFRKVAVYKESDAENKIRNAVTHYEVLGRYAYKNNSYTHLKLKLETGRTHQIRVHMAYLGHPVIGDEVYGNENINKNFAFLQGQCLHSKSIEFSHPITGEKIFIESDLPEYFMRVLELLKKT
ncbi:MAG: RluA family pseudouridine synthase [Oscillospiraceae bacterium]|nr:RluA family pseudouridine synthase [Oscillospiraceae bacterium]